MMLAKRLANLLCEHEFYCVSKSLLLLRKFSIDFGEQL